MIINHDVYCTGNLINDHDVSVMKSLSYSYNVLDVLLIIFKKFLLLCLIVRSSIKMYVVTFSGINWTLFIYYGNIKHCSSSMGSDGDVIVKSISRFIIMNVHNQLIKLFDITSSTRYDRRCKYKKYKYLWPINNKLNIRNKIFSLTSSERYFFLDNFIIRIHTDFKSFDKTSFIRSWTE